jgi:hypothetical protein
MEDILNLLNQNPLTIRAPTVLPPPRNAPSSSISREFWATGLVELVSGVAWLYFNNPIYLVLGASSLVFFATRCVKHLFDNFKIMNWIESSSYALTREAPYIYLVAFLVAIVTAHLFLELSISVASLNAILSAFTLDPAMRRGFCEGEHNVHL